MHFCLMEETNDCSLSHGLGKSSANIAEMSACMFPVNNITQPDATLDHFLNKDRSHWEAKGELASSRSMDRTAQR